ncbi:unnamed protein product [Protopolystoma xenopodis]|uniref:Uncharacterized protein n=1 Tax=Protopolystoma xenopodis TaxID=117903 RepID=A0A448WZU2_9PLAT|nr:unnamed protein product [Protopolystoma xenopodis]
MIDFAHATPHCKPRCRASLRVRTARVFACLSRHFSPTVCRLVSSCPRVIVSRQHGAGEPAVLSICSTSCRTDASASSADQPPAWPASPARLSACAADCRQPRLGLMRTDRYRLRPLGAIAYAAAAAAAAAANASVSVAVAVLAGVTAKRLTAPPSAPSAPSPHSAPSPPLAPPPPPPPPRRCCPHARPRRLLLPSALRPRQLRLSSSHRPRANGQPRPATAQPTRRRRPLARRLAAVAAGRHHQKRFPTSPRQPTSLPRPASVGAGAHQVVSRQPTPSRGAPSHLAARGRPVVCLLLCTGPSVSGMRVSQAVANRNVACVCRYDGAIVHKT